jgi:hypothetical protein
VQSDSDYFRGRAQEELDASITAKSTAARKAHLELAHRYTDLAAAIDKSAGQPAANSLADAQPSIG